MDLEQYDIEQKIVKNVKRLSNYIRDVYLQTEDEKFHTFRSDYKTFQKQLILLYDKWFPKAKQCSDFDIVNQIYKQDIKAKDIKVWIKYSFVCLIKTSDRIFINAVNYKQENEHLLFHHEMSLLYEIAFEAAIFIENSFRIFEKKELSFGHWKRFSIYARETHNASEQLLRKLVIPKSHGEFVVSPTSIFLLRQSIELWLYSIFGIQYISDKSDQAVKLQPEILFRLIDASGSRVQLPVPKSVIEKIHSWSQPYIHAGWLIHIWEIELAQHVLRPIFDSSKVIIKRNHYYSIEKQLRKLLKKESIVLHRRTSPDCTLVN